MTRERNNVATVDRFVNGGAVIHVRFAGRSFDVPLRGLDLTAHSDDVQVKHVGNLGRGEHRSQFVDGHRCHVVCSLALHVISTVRVPVVLRGRVRPAVQRSV